MNRKTISTGVFLAAAIMLFFTGLAFRTPFPAMPITHNAVNQSGKSEALKTFKPLPLSFEANYGQTDDQVKFLSRNSGYSLFLTPAEAVLSLRKSALTKRQSRIDLASTTNKNEGDQAVEQTTLRMQLVGANAAPQVIGLEELPGKVNYFLGNDPTKWRTDIPTYSQVRYQAVYPGVDLVYYGNDRQLEYDFIVAPGADPAVIKLGFAGAENLEVDTAGELVVKIVGEEVRMRKPVIYQEWDGEREDISGGYALLTSAEGAGDGPPQVGFYMDAYDTGRPLVIDPVLVYSTYLGGSNGEQVRGFVVDKSGNTFVSGATFSSDFPTANAVQSTFGGGGDIFVTKLSATGALIYSTYLGGSGFEDGGFDLAVDTGGNAFIVGPTNSSNFPTKNAVQSMFGGGSNDAIVTKLDAAGALVYSTYLGGNAVDSPFHLAVDASGSAHVVGGTFSTNFPTANAVQSTFGGERDVFITKLNATGGFVYSTYLGGNNIDDTPQFALDTNGNAYVTGRTRSSNFPTVNAAQSTLLGDDVFLTKFDATGGFIYSTYLGGNAIESFPNLAVDASGNAYIGSTTSSTNFPTVNAVQSTYGGSVDVFVTKFNATGEFVYSTYLGGNGFEVTRDFTVDASGNAYITGDTPSPNFPTANAVQSTFGGQRDVFVTKLNATGGFVYSTYLGGSSFDDLPVIAVDMSGNAYILGETSSPNFPTANAVQSIYGGGLDAFVTKLNTTGGFIYSSYFGGSGNDFGRFSPVVDISGNAYIVSGTSSPNFPTVNAVQATFGGGFQDAFVMKLNTIGGFVYSTYLGGSGVEGVGDFAVDASSNVYVVGFTSSSNFPTANAVQPTLGGFNDPFVFKLAENQPPIADADGPYSVNEGASVTVTASGNDAENGPLTYAWDLDNDGSFEISGQTATFDAATLDGPSTHTIKVQVTDNGGLMATDQATVNVLNVAPTATFTGTPSTIIIGQSVTLEFSNPSDPSEADVTAGFKYSYACNNDDSFDDVDVATTSHTCTYPNSGTFTVKGRIKDEDGGFTDYTVDIVVQTSQEATGSLIDQVQALIDAGILNQGQGNGLIAKLEAAIQQLENGNTNAAINQLQSFINQVNDYMSSTPPILTAAEGQALIDAANAIIAALSATGKAAQLNSGSSDAMIKTAGTLPTGYRLEQNSPNPFNPVTTIQFAVPRESHVRLKVYNSFGAEVATLVNQQVTAGTYKINWDASRLASGFYLYRLEAEGFAQTKKLLLMK